MAIRNAITPDPVVPDPVVEDPVVPDPVVPDPVVSDPEPECDAACQMEKARLKALKVAEEA